MRTPPRRSDAVLPYGLVLRSGYVLGHQSLGTVLDLELNFDTLVEGPIALHLNGGKMNENIFSCRALYESVTLDGIKPLHDTFFFHAYILLDGRPRREVLLLKTDPR